MVSQIIVSGFRKIKTPIDIPEIKFTLEACKSSKITGISLCTEGVFLNVMEGYEMQTSAIIEALQAHTRFSGVHIIIKNSLHKREFDDYKIGVTQTHLPDRIPKAFILDAHSYKKHLSKNASPEVGILINAFARVNALP